MKSAIGNRKMKIGFTLVELLVVIAIIAILLALLTPALDKVIYRTELLACGAKQKAVASTASMYAVDNNRWYVYREGMYARGDWKPDVISAMPQGDDRPELSRYMPINDLLNCPMSPRADFADTLEDSYVASSYELYFGFVYLEGNHKGMKKLGDPWFWDGKRYNVIVADHDHVVTNGAQYYGAHPDRDGLMYRNLYEDAGPIHHTYGRWELVGPHRGLVDLNNGFDDGSVALFENVPNNTVEFSDVMDTVPVFTNAPGNYNSGQNSWGYWAHVGPGR